MSKIYFLGPVTGRAAFETPSGVSLLQDKPLYKTPVIPGYIFEAEVNSPPDLSFESGAVSIEGRPIKNICPGEKALAPDFLKEEEEPKRQDS